MMNANNENMHITGPEVGELNAVVSLKKGSGGTAFNCKMVVLF